MNQVIHDCNNSTIAQCHPEEPQATVILSEASGSPSGTLCYLGLGSNLGDRAGQITRAIELLNSQPKVKVICKSNNYENPAIEDAGPHDFLNAVVEIETKLSPLDLLDLVLNLELEIDPERNSRGRKQARKIDIDVLTYGELELEHERLVLPHPRMNQRDFVKVPLAELSSQLSAHSSQERDS